MEFAACLTSKEVIIIVTVFFSKQVGGDAGAGEETGITCHAEVITYVDGYLQHIHGAFYKVHRLHTILSIVIVRYMVVHAPGGIIPFGEEDACAHVQFIKDLIVEGEAEGASWPIACQGVDGCEIGCEQESYAEGPVDTEGGA